jgi:type II secretory pathway component GspD/PulD (secretin)
MEITMKLLLRGLLVASMLAFAMTASSQGASDSSASASAAPAGDSGVPISKIIAVVAKKTGKKFIVDPRVEAGIHLVGQDVANVDYPGLLAMLRIYNVAALEEDGYVFVIPDARILRALGRASVRQQPADGRQRGQHPPDRGADSRSRHGW